MNNSSWFSSCSLDKRQDPLVAYPVSFISDTFGFNSPLPALVAHSLWTSVREAAASCTLLQKFQQVAGMTFLSASSQATKSRIQVLVSSIIERWRRSLPPDHYCVVGQMWGLKKLCDVKLHPAEDAVARILTIETPVTIWTGIDHPVGNIGYPESALLYAKFPIIIIIFLKANTLSMSVCATPVPS